MEAMELDLHSLGPHAVGLELRSSIDVLRKMQTQQGDWTFDKYIKNVMLFPGTGFRQEHLPREGEIRETGNGKRRKDWKQPFRGLFTNVRTV
jgi:hypothetical protein